MFFTKTMNKKQNYKKLMEGAIKALGEQKIKQPMG